MINNERVTISAYVHIFLAKRRTAIL